MPMDARYEPDTEESRLTTQQDQLAALHQLSPSDDGLINPRLGEVRALPPAVL